MSPLPRPVVLRPVQGPGPSGNSKLVIGSPAIVRGNQELRELALQISQQVLRSQSQGSEGMAQAGPSRKGRLAVTLVGSTAAGLLLAVALWTGPTLIRAAGAQLAAIGSPAMPQQAKFAPAANPLSRPLHALSMPPARSGAEAFGALRLKQPQWSVSAAAAPAAAAAQAAAAATAAAAGNSPAAAAQPKPEADTTASIAPRQVLQDPDPRHAAPPIAAAAVHARPIADPAHRTRRSKRPAAPPEVAPALSGEPPVEPADLPVAPSMPDVAGRTGFKR